MCWQWYGPQGSPGAERWGRGVRAKSPAPLWAEEVALRRAAAPLEQEVKGEDGLRVAYLLGGAWACSDGVLVCRALGH